MDLVISAVSSRNFIYKGGHQSFSAFDAPGLILTQLSKEHFSHLETAGTTTDLIVVRQGKQQTLRFLNDSFDKFMVILRDESILDASELDEHIILDERY